MNKKYLILFNESTDLNQTPFLKNEFGYLNNNFVVQLIASREQIIKPSHIFFSVKRLIFVNVFFILKAYFCELIKSKRPLFYLKHHALYFNIWIGWFREARIIHAYLKNFDPQDTIIYTYWYEQQAMSLTILKAQGKLPFKWVSRAHGWDVDKSQRPDNIIPFRYWMLKHKPDRLVSISSFGKQIFEKEYGAKAEVSRLGTHDLGIAKLNLDANTLKIVSISTIIPLKRVELIVKVLSACKVNIAWTHFGDGPLMDSIPWGALPNHVSIVKKGHLKHEELLAELKETGFDLMLHFSELEGIPVSIMECMSLGIPVMACDAGGVKEILNNNNGWLLPIDLNILETARTIENIAENKELIQEKKQKARDTWEKEYNAAVNFPKFIETFLS